jgi:hypothetical protein
MASILLLSFQFLKFDVIDECDDNKPLGNWMKQKLGFNTKVYTP